MCEPSNTILFNLVNPDTWNKFKSILLHCNRKSFKLIKCETDGTFLMMVALFLGGWNTDEVCEIWLVGPNRQNLQHKTSTWRVPIVLQDNSTKKKSTQNVWNEMMWDQSQRYSRLTFSIWKNGLKNQVLLTEMMIWILDIMIAWMIRHRKILHHWCQANRPHETCFASKTIPTLSACGDTHILQRPSRIIPHIFHNPSHPVHFPSIKSKQP
jgi:hypothetical protein